MQTLFCDKCGEKLSDRWRAPIEIRIENEHFELCKGCGAGLVEMLKDMRLMKETETIR